MRSMSMGRSGEGGGFSHGRLAPTAVSVQYGAMPMPPPPPPDYWRRTLRMTAVLLGIWFFVTFVIGYFARELDFSFFGWPFSFWVAAQGALIVYVVIVWFYARRMDRLDHEYGVAENDEGPPPPSR
jgi:putative solute:sodium symporter small subunit